MGLQTILSALNFVNGPQSNGQEQTSRINSRDHDNDRSWDQHRGHKGHGKWHGKGKGKDC